MNKINNYEKRVYPACPNCKAKGEKGLKITAYRNLCCRSCNSMFKLEYDFYHIIKIGKSKESGLIKRR